MASSCTNRRTCQLGAQAGSLLLCLLQLLAAAPVQAACSVEPATVWLTCCGIICLCAVAILLHKAREWCGALQCNRERL